ncbi:hypothetical protein BHM03_00011677 [Ensete ventricosum]|nr:hypothetical protein BHM03_00011677 [Ensete ventricosum]
MEFFAGARVVRWQSVHNKYPVAEDDERRESQHQDRSSSGGARWTVEVVTDILHQPCLRLKSCHGRYLAASLRKRAFLRLAGTKAAQKFPGHPALPSSGSPSATASTSCSGASSVRPSARTPPHIDPPCIGGGNGALQRIGVYPKEKDEPPPRPSPPVAAAQPPVQSHLAVAFNVNSKGEWYSFFGRILLSLFFMVLCGRPR